MHYGAPVFKDPLRVQVSHCIRSIQEACMGETAAAASGVASNSERQVMAAGVYYSQDL